MTSSLRTLELQKADWRLRVSPELGGCVMGLWLGSTPILRTAPDDTARAGQSAAYPLVPYSNRIGQGQMTWRGQTFNLRNGFNAEPHALHGVGFMRAWSVQEHGAAHLRLRLLHQPDEFWPFAFEAEQHFELRDDGLKFTISARNTDSRPQPMGLGWHPYFVQRAGATLDLPAHTQWLSGDDKLPRTPQAVDGLRGEVADMRLDHCFEATKSAVACLTDAELRVTLQADSRYWVVYTPMDAAYHCAEPVTHRNNAVQDPEPLKSGLVELAAGGVLSMQARLTAQHVA